LYTIWRRIVTSILSKPPQDPRVTCGRPRAQSVNGPDLDAHDDELDEEFDDEEFDDEFDDDEELDDDDDDWEDEYDEEFEDLEDE
jgi:hypothetical protein